MSGRPFKEVVGLLNQITPLELAGSWDNVGVLIEPTSAATKKIDSIFVTNDLTENVLDEAIEGKCSMIVAYHPPLFASFKKITPSVTSQRIALKAIEHGIPVYSPHSALDAIKGGINDWIADALNTLAPSSRKPIEASQFSTSARNTQKVEICLSASAPSNAIATASSLLQSIDDSATIHTTPSTITACIDSSKIPQVSKAIESMSSYASWNIYSGIKYSSGDIGSGRLLRFDGAGVGIDQVIKCVKDLFGLQYVRLGRPQNLVDKPIRSVAICPGSGSSVILKTHADLYLTGELSHHEILEACAKGNYVIVCDHSNSERGFLKEYKKMIEAKLGSDITVTVSIKDADPLIIV
eukprot:gene10785-12565_t